MDVIVQADFVQGRRGMDGYGQRSNKMRFADALRALSYTRTRP